MGNKPNNFDMPEIVTFGDIDLNTLESWTTRIGIGDDFYSLEFSISTRYPNSSPNIQGYWQDFVIANLDALAKNIKAHSLTEAQQNISFIFKNVGYVMNAKFNLIVPKIDNNKILDSLSIDNVLEFEQNIIENKKKKPNVK